MFFSKKEQAKPVSKASENKATAFFPNIKEEDIHIMPGKYVAIKPPAAKKTGRNMAVILVFLVLFLVFLLGGAAWYIIQSRPKPAVNNNQNITANININANTNTAPVNENTNNNVNANINGNTNTDINNNQNINNNTNTVVTPPADNLDSDADGLTLTEESLYGTDPALADTDKDGYKDGQEIMNFYNPLVVNQSLLDSALVKKYNNEFFDYELLVPKNWLVQSVDDSRSQINFIPDASTGETISIIVTGNPQHLELSDWQKTLFSGQELDNFRLSSYSALRTSDGRQVLMVTYDNVFTITYSLSNQSNKNFSTTFEMMLKSFKLLEE